MKIKDQLDGKPRPPIFCVDLDGTIAQFDGWKGHKHIGDPFSGAAEFVRRLSSLGKVVLFTVRMSKKAWQTNVMPLADRKTLIEKWLHTWGFPSNIEIYDGAGKPFADVYIDDRGFYLEPSVDESTLHYFHAFEAIKRRICNG